MAAPRIDRVTARADALVLQDDRTRTAKRAPEQQPTRAQGERLQEALTLVQRGVGKRMVADPASIRRIGDRGNNTNVVQDRAARL
jgi:hypothetical protein